MTLTGLLYQHSMKLLDELNIPSEHKNKAVITSKKQYRNQSKQGELLVTVSSTDQNLKIFYTVDIQYLEKVLSKKEFANVLKMQGEQCISRQKDKAEQ